MAMKRAEEHYLLDAILLIVASTGASWFETREDALLTMRV
jgi:hypothetical protein